VINLYDVAVFENHMYLTSWRLQNVLKLHKFNSSSHELLMTNLSRPFTIHVYHRQEQPESKIIFKNKYAFLMALVKNIVLISMILKFNILNILCKTEFTISFII